MKEIRVKISKNGTLTLPKEIKDEFKGTRATLMPLKSGSFKVKKTLENSLSKEVVGRPLTTEDVESMLRKVRPDLLESTKAESENLTSEEVAKRFRELGKTITPEELEEAIKEVRAEEAKRKNW